MIKEFINNVYKSGYTSPFIIFLIISFIIGVIMTMMINKYINKNNLKTFYIEFKDMVLRFLINFLRSIPIIFILVALYFIFLFFKLEDKTLPGLIDTGISVLLITFLINERNYREKKELIVLLDNKIDRIYKKSKDIILKFIDFEKYEDGEITKELILNVLAKKNLLNDKINVKYINKEGLMMEESIPLIDNLYYMGNELKPVVNEVIQYGIYLDYKKLSAIIKLEEILNKRIFVAKVSKTEGINTQNCDEFLYPLVDSIMQILSILDEIKEKKGKKRGDY